MTPSRRFGIVFPRGGIDPIGAAVAGGFTEAGCAVQPLIPGRAWDLAGLDYVVIYGPMQSLAETIATLRRHQHRPPVLVWLTEQLADPRGPYRAQTIAARLRFGLESLSWPAVVRRQPPLGSAGVPPASDRAGGTPALPSSGARLSPSVAAALLRRAGRLRILGELLALRDLGCLALVAAFTETNAGCLWRHGLPAAVAPMGYHPSYGGPLGLERDIDVVFLGTLRDRRRTGIVRRLQRDLDRRGIALTLRDGSASHGYAYGEVRTVLLNRAKIMLNIMRQPWDDGIHRMLLAAPNGAMVVSEPIIATSWGPFRPDVHFVMAPHDRLAETIARYLADADARRTIAGRAYDSVVNGLTMRAAAERVLEALG